MFPKRLQGLLHEVTKYNTPLGTTTTYILRTEKKYCFKISDFKTPEGQEMPAYEIDNTTNLWIPNESQRRAWEVAAEGNSYFYMPPWFLEQCPLQGGV